MIGVQFEKAELQGDGFTPELVVLDMDSHERVGIGVFSVELVRVTHSIPESSAIVVDTPRGRLINTGDFRLDPEPLDAMPSDIQRLTDLGKEGVLLLMSESTNTTKPGRTPTEHTLQDSFYHLVEHTKGRVIVAMFSTNMNRIQMVINAAHQSGRKVALDGRSMITVAELAVRLGRLKVPKDTLVALSSINTFPDDEVMVLCTGGQGEPGAALSRMAMGEHKVVKLRAADTVVISSTPIPGNERSYAKIGDLLSDMGVKQYRHPTHEIDGSGPLHVSGHAARDEHAEMIRLTNPTYVMPIYGGSLHRHYHKDIALREGYTDETVLMATNGTVIEFDAQGVAHRRGRVTTGARFIDKTGALVPEIVTRDRLHLTETGFVTIIVTLSTQGALMANIDILTRGYIAAKDNPRILNGVRARVKGVVRGRKEEVRSKVAIEILRQSIQSSVAGYLFKITGTVPIIIPVVNMVGVTQVQQRPVADIH
tara:strand:- start:645 stop:2087 length:1443 start_codon:yes stop_codon:yes gene_type:complete